jgi:hypothetical protein
MVSAGYAGACIDCGRNAACEGDWRCHPCGGMFRPYDRCAACNHWRKNHPRGPCIAWRYNGTTSPGMFNDYGGEFCRCERFSEVLSKPTPDDTP